jgi:DNA (cytosine-5)-methyltransferase 1
MNYYNDNDPKAAAWLKELIKAGLIPPGDVDERSIKDVTGNDLKGYTQVHMFAGIGGWAEALRIAGVNPNEPLWTGSCPCQPFSCAGQGKGEKDERHLWPEFFRLIRERKPPLVFGEQVESAEVVGTQLEASFIVAVQRGDYARANKLAKRLVTSKSFHYHKRWLDGVRSDLETEGYSFGFAILGAHSAGAPHIRQRLYWVADSSSGGGYIRRGTSQKRLGNCRGEEKTERGGVQSKTSGLCLVGRLDDPKSIRRGILYSENIGETDGEINSFANSSDCQLFGMDNPISDRRRTSGNDNGKHDREQLDADVNIGGVVYSDGERWPSRIPASGAEWTDGSGSTSQTNFWTDSIWLPCRDGKARRISPKREIFPLAHGLPGRVGILRGAGNAICPQTAAAFIESFFEIRKQNELID